HPSLPPDPLLLSPFPSSRLLSLSQVPALPAQPLSPPTPSHSSVPVSSSTKCVPAFFFSSPLPPTPKGCESLADTLHW
ncbi:hypothetical protein CRENBAI_007457, partial [Crenichthys baileyi]